MKNKLSKKVNDPMDIHYYLDQIKDFSEEEKRCVYCDHIRGFRNKIPQCGLKKCIYDIYESEECEEDWAKWK